MLAELARGDCADGTTCPAPPRTDRNMAIHQEWAMTEAKPPGQLDMPGGQQAAKAPTSHIAEVLRAC
jgi:hypothetical protein